MLIALVGAVLVLTTAVMRAVWIIPQARARNVERLGRYHRTLEPGISFIVPFVDRVKPLIDLREQVVSFKAQPVITEDNLVVYIDTVLFFQVTDPRAADYEIVDYIKAIEQLTATTLRNVIGTLDLEESLTSRDRINTALRGVIDDASGKWGIRVTRVEIKAIDPPPSIKDAMEKQMRAEREKRAAILTAEGLRQSKILTAEGEKQSAILKAEGERRSLILKAEGQAQAIEEVFGAIHDNDPDPKLLAYQYLQTLPQLAQGEGNTFWVIPGEVTSALRAVSQAFGGADEAESGAPDERTRGRGRAEVGRGREGRNERGRERTSVDAGESTEAEALVNSPVHTPPYELGPGMAQAGPRGGSLASPEALAEIAGNAGAEPGKRRRRSAEGPPNNAEGSPNTDLG
ncbi:SPFH domain-containing protein [Actinomadura alba]|nr:SPFH domain-containing protein [Actinomadura alba]